MEMLQLYVVYDEYLKPVDSNIGSFNRHNHKIDRINIEINEELPAHTFYLNVKRPDGTVNLLGYEVVQVDGTNYYFDVPSWVTEEDGLVEFSLVASTETQVISYGKFYVDCIDTLQATAQATPDDPTFLSKVDKDLSTYNEVETITNAFVYVDNDGEPEKIEISNTDKVGLWTGDFITDELAKKVDKDLSLYDEAVAIFENAFTYVDNDGEPEKIGIVSGDIETDVVLWTGGKIKSELDLKQDVITDNSIGNDLLAQMPTMTLKGNDTLATANAQDLTPSEVMELLSPSGLMEVPHNLKVYGDIEQVGGSYETHQEQLFTTKDHIILRDGAVGGLGTGSYAGLFAKLADGTNNSGLVFDGDGMARVGDIGTNLASPDFSQTQVLATRQDTPAVEGIPYWNSLLKRFDTDGGFFYDNVAGSLFVPSEVRTLYVAGTSGSNNSRIALRTAGTTISRNIADTNPALKVDLTHASSTGDILELQAGGVEVASINKTGVFTGNGLDIDGGILHYGQELFRQVWNISSIDTIYSDITTLPSGQGNGIVLPALTSGVLPLKLYEYSGTLAEWVYLVTVRSHTLYTVLGTGKIYRYTMSSPYFIEMTNKYNNATSGLTATNYQGAIDELESKKAPLIEPTFTNNAIGDVPLTVNAMVGTTADVQSWQVNNSPIAYIRPNGDMRLTGLNYSYGLYNNYSSNYSKIDLLNTGTVISRNIADTNPALIINEQQGTGNIANFQFGGANKLEVTKDGWLFQNGVRLLHTFSHPTGSTAIPAGRNVFIGQEAGNLTMGATATSTYQGSYNGGVGYQALYSNTTGSFNTANGNQALYSNTTGSYNTANGMEALRSNTTGSYNTANGTNAGRYFGSSTSPLTLINNSVFIGMNSRANANNETNEIVIGYEALGKGSNTATIGNSSLTGLYLGSATAKFYGLVDYDNTTSGLTATDQKSAIDELAGLVDGIETLLAAI